MLGGFFFFFCRLVAVADNDETKRQMLAAKLTKIFSFSDISFCTLLLLLLFLVLCFGLIFCANYNQHDCRQAPLLLGNLFVIICFDVSMYQVYLPFFFLGAIPLTLRKY